MEKRGKRGLKIATPSTYGWMVIFALQVPTDVSCFATEFERNLVLVNLQSNDFKYYPEIVVKKQTWITFTGIIWVLLGGFTFGWFIRLLSRVFPSQCEPLLNWFLYLGQVKSTENSARTGTFRDMWTPSIHINYSNQLAYYTLWRSLQQGAKFSSGSRLVPPPS